MRPSVIIFAFFYLLSAAGYGAEVHYCLGMVSDVSYIWFDASCACDADGDHIQTQSNCCDEEAFYYQLEEEHLAAGNLDLQAPLLNVESDLDFASCPSAEDNSSNASWSDRGPPNVLDRTIVYQQLIFYG